MIQSELDTISEQVAYSHFLPPILSTDTIYILKPFLTVDFRLGLPEDTVFNGIG